MDSNVCPPAELQREAFQDGLFDGYFRTLLRLGGANNHNLPQSGRLLYCVLWGFFANEPKSQFLRRADRSA
jgi:hypothetical protein